MQKAVVIVLALIFVCASGASRSRADQGGKENKALAQEHYRAGLRAYNIGDFDRAIKEWKTAYQHLGAADFLFNIAQAYRQKRDYEEAIFFYNAYLRGKPDAPNVAEVTALRDEMIQLHKNQVENEKMPPEPRKLLGPEGESSELPPSEGAQSPGAASEGEREALPRADSSGKASGPVEDSSSAGKGLRTTGLITGAAGVAFVATGVAFALSASSTENELEEAAANRQAWSDELADMEASADRSATVATVLVVAGATGILAGGALYYLGHRKEGQAPDGSGRALALQPTLSLGAGGARAGLSLGMEF